MYTRGWIPHLDAGERAQGVTFRLIDSLPAEVLARFYDDTVHLPDEPRAVARRRLIERFLDSGHGDAFLAAPDAGRIVEGALRHFHGQRYDLRAWVVMPNHVHVLFTPILPHAIGNIVKSWKQFASNALNRLRGTTGPVWQRDYRDRAVRDDSHLADSIRYIEWNPVQAGLCERPEDWPFGSARFNGAQ